MKETKQDLDRYIRPKLLGLNCWYVNSGGSGTGSSFSLAFGEKVARQVPLQNSAHPEEYRQFEGSADLLVWCTWRLDGADEPVTSSDDSAETIARGLGSLAGCRIIDMELGHPCWDLKIVFSSHYKLQVFCDHVPGEPSFDGNWELHLQGESLYFGPGNKLQLEAR